MLKRKTLFLVFTAAFMLALALSLNSDAFAAPGDAIIRKANFVPTYKAGKVTPNLAALAQSGRRSMALLKALGKDPSKPSSWNFPQNKKAPATNGATNERLSRVPTGTPQIKKFRMPISGTVETQLRNAKSAARGRPVTYPPRKEAGPAPAGMTANIKVNQDLSVQPQNEPSVAGWQGQGVMFGYNDYRVPGYLGFIGGGYTAGKPYGKWQYDGLLPIPALSWEDSGGTDATEPANGTGDPSVALQYDAGNPAKYSGYGDGTFYQTTLGFSFSQCENGVFAYNSEDGGANWTWPDTFNKKGEDFTVDTWVAADSCVTGALGTLYNYDLFLDKEYLAVDNTHGPYSHPGRLYVTLTWFERFWITASNSEEDDELIGVYHSDDGGKTWTLDTLLGKDQAPGLCKSSAPSINGPEACDASTASIPVVNKDGTVSIAMLNGNSVKFGWTAPYHDQYLVYTLTYDDSNGSQCSNADQLCSYTGPNYVTEVADGTGYDFPLNHDSSPRPTLSDANFRIWSAGNIASDPVTGALYVAFADDYTACGWVGACKWPDAGGSATTDTDIWILKSTDNGLTWFAPSSKTPFAAQRVNQDPNANHKDQWFPWVAAYNDNVGVLYLDRRTDQPNDALPASRLSNAFFSFSTNGAVSFRDQQLSTAASDLNLGFVGSTNDPRALFIGDYTNLAYTGNGTWTAAWVDARNASPSSRNADIYTVRFTK